jgi:hypothetical protein
VAFFISRRDFMRRKLAFGLVLACFGTLAHAETYQYSSALNGFQEVPQTNTFGVGVISLTLDDSDLTASGTGLVFFLSGEPTDFHIHNAPYGSSGPVVLPIGPFAFSGNDVSFDITLSTVAEFNALKAVLDAENGNIHTAAFPSGEIRGQIASVVPEPATLAVVGLGLLGVLRRRKSA